MNTLLLALPRRLGPCLIIALLVILLVPAAAGAQAAPVTPPAGVVTGNLQPFTDPSLVPHAMPYQPYGEPEYSHPERFLGGRFEGGVEVRVTPTSWPNWNPSYWNIHVIYAASGVLDIYFDTPQKAALVKVQPYNFGLHDITLDARGWNDVTLGTFTLPVEGNAGATLMGLMSSKFNILHLRITSAPEAGGFGVGEITYTDSYNISGWVFLDGNLDAWRNPWETAGLADVPVYLQRYGETLYTVHTWAPMGYFEFPPVVIDDLPYCMTADPGPAYEGTLGLTKCVGPMLGIDSWNIPVRPAGCANSQGTIEGRVYRDANGNAVQDADEAGIAAAPVCAQHVFLGTKTCGDTDTDGAYAICVPPGGYHVAPAKDAAALQGLTSTGPWLDLTTIVRQREHRTVSFGYR